MSSLEEMGKNLERIDEAIDFVNNCLSQENFDLPAMRSSTYRDGAKAYLEESPAGASTPLATSHTLDPELNALSNQNEPEVPLELIADCIAAVLMIMVNMAQVAYTSIDCLIFLWENDFLFLWMKVEKV